jgi:hypothetical protein
MPWFWIGMQCKIWGGDVFFGLKKNKQTEFLPFLRMNLTIATWKQLITHIKATTEILWSEEDCWVHYSWANTSIPTQLQSF